MDTSTTKDKFARFGRSVALLFNRSMMYQKSHPMVKDAIKEVHSTAELLFYTISPLVFILNREQFYVDEEPLDPRMNVKRIATLFKNHGIQSVSFDTGLTTSELEIFVDIFSTMSMSTDAEAVKKILYTRGVYSIKVNHVLYKKVSQDDQVVSRDALKNVTPSLEAEDSESRKKFMDTLLETILTEEFANTLNIKSLLANPSQVSQNMIAADNASAVKMGGSNGSAATPDAATGNDRTGGDGTGSGGIGGLGGGIDTDGMSIGAGSGFIGPDSGGGSGIGGGPGSGGGAGQGSATDSGTAAAVHGLAGTEPTVSGSAASTAGAPLADVGTHGGSPTSGHAGAAGGISPAVIGSDNISGDPAHGPMLLHQLELMQQEVKHHIEGEGQVSLEDLADAVFEMKKQLFENIETQKALGVAYANENAIVSNINELTDQVLIKLVQEEYQAGKVTTQRLSQIILRLIPDASDLKRLLPQIKAALMESGMPIEDYLDLVEQLKQELQNEELSRIIEESSESIGVDSEDLISELKDNPGQSAKLIYLASEIRKGTGDESALADILVDYVEQMGSEAAKKADGGDGDAHLKNVISDVESTVLQQLGKLDVGDDVLVRMEENINNRMDAIMDKMRAEWLNTQAESSSKEKIKRLTVLQTLEHSVTDDEELDEILKEVRGMVEAGEIEENNFSQIHAEINRQEKLLAESGEGVEVPEGVLTSNELMFILDKEIARAERYNANFSVMAFSFVNAKPNSKTLSSLVTAESVMAAALEKLVSTIREVDYIGQIGKNKIVALLPMSDYASAKKALGRVMSLLHAEPLEVNEVPIQLRVAGVAAQWDADQELNAQAFAKQVSNKLMDMVSRVKNIQVLF